MSVAEAWHLESANEGYLRALNAVVGEQEGEVE